MQHTDIPVRTADQPGRQSLQLTDTHRTLGIAGLMPFIGLSLVAISGSELYSLYLLTYAALIFSFLGGVLWFVSLNQQAPGHLAWISVSVMLWAWSWLHPQFPAALLLAAASFIGLHLYERYYLAGLYPQAFMTLRSMLTVIASVSLAVAALLGG
ncbi:MAG: DUF3429 domain-containing protein [Amphritea sp.]|nr:DUF3429 domain-containing protein [Amphritea sp.]